MSTLSWWLAVATLVHCGSPPPPAQPRVFHPAARTGLLEHRMANCPSALPTAKTVAEDVPGGVALTITTTDDAARRALLSLADMHQRIGSVQGKRIEHTGMHGGPGYLGHCPVIHVGTHVSYVRVAGGVRVEVRVLPGHDVEALRREIYTRTANLSKSIAKQ